MTYLFDINVLLALAIEEHQFHARVRRWLTDEVVSDVATCSTTELGFLRVLLQWPMYRLSMAEARNSLTKILASPRINHVFLADDNDSSHLPGWVKGPKQITDGHLLKLSHRYGMMLATLDEKIPGAHLIP